MLTMLGIKTYTQDYIDACRSRVESQLGTYRNLAATVPVDPAFESVFFNNMVLSLDSYFTHRLRGIEGKDGNPLNEVRVLCKSMTENGDRMTEDPTIRMNPATSVLHHEVGDTIRLGEQDFRLLSKAFFAEIESRFGA